MKLTHEQKTRICNDARAAWARRHTPLLACPHPVGTDEDFHWKAYWILAGGTLN